MFFVVFFMFAILFLYFFEDSPQDNIIKNRCFISPPLKCMNDGYFIAAERIGFVAKNSYSKPMIINSMQLIDDNKKIYECLDFQEKTINLGEKEKIFCEVPEEFVVANISDKEKVLFNIKYHSINGDKKYSKTLSGEIISKVV